LDKASTCKIDNVLVLLRDICSSIELLFGLLRLGQAPRFDIPARFLPLECSLDEHKRLKIVRRELQVLKYRHDKLFANAVDKVWVKSLARI